MNFIGFPKNIHLGDPIHLIFLTELNLRENENHVVSLPTLKLCFLRARNVNTLSLIRMNLISAGSISLDSTFNTMFLCIIRRNILLLYYIKSVGEY